MSQGKSACKELQAATALTLAANMAQLAVFLSQSAP